MLSNASEGLVGLATEVIGALVRRLGSLHLLQHCIDVIQDGHGEGSLESLMFKVSVFTYISSEIFKTGSIKSIKDIYAGTLKFVDHSSSVD